MIPLVRRFAASTVGAGRAGLDLLFPPRCACCDADLPEAGLSDDPPDRILLCEDCRRLLGPELWPGCQRCGATGAPDQPASRRCGLCRNTNLRFDTAVPLGGYSDDLREVVLRMKRPTNDVLSVAMGRLLAFRRAELLTDFNAHLIVPVPMYWTRRLARGTNSPDLIAQSLGKFMGISVSRRPLVRCRNTMHQKDLSPKERFRNVRGAFRVRSGQKFDGLRILLVDDILTTGATCSEAASALKKAGAATVAAVVVARAQSVNTT